MPEETTLICIVDDDVSVRRSLQRLLAASGYRVEAFPDAASFLAHTPARECGCVVLDVCMPNIDGLELQKRLRERGRAVAIVFLTGHGDIPMSVRAIKEGGADFLTKPVDEEVLLAAIGNAVALQRRLADADKDLAAMRERVGLLTPREDEVMRCVITGALNKQIAAYLGIAEKTVKIHRSRVMSKLQVRSVADLLQVCLKLGIEPLTEL